MNIASINNLIVNHKLDKPELKQYFSNNTDKTDKSLSIQLQEMDSEVISFINRNLTESDKIVLNVSTAEFSNFDNFSSIDHKAIINPKKINSIRFLNKYFELLNLKLTEKGKFIGCVETYAIRRDKLKRKYPIIIFQVVLFFDFFFHRLMPKLFLTKKLYFFITSGRNRVFSRAEIYGRLYSCGFEIIDNMNHSNLNYFIAKKNSNPHFDLNPTYGPFISLKRVGKDKELFKVYKIRTMHPYSEYLQEYVYNHNNLKEGGKFKDDFRISPLGRILRKFWIDEIPMLYNVLKGDMKLVGVRPLSQHYFSLYPKDVQDLRTKFKPGFIPPFYADNPKTLSEIIASEKKYLLAYQKNSIKTDFTYLVKSLNNVIFGGLRSF